MIQDPPAPSPTALRVRAYREARKAADPDWLAKEAARVRAHRERERAARLAEAERLAREGWLEPWESRE